MLGNLGNLLSDENFWDGVGKGFTRAEELAQERKARDVRELRNFAIETGMSVREANDKALQASEGAVIELASLIKGKRNVRDKSVREGALALLNKYGSIEAAAQVARDLSTEYKTFGRDPIKTLGFVEEDLTSRATPTMSQISRKYTKLKPMPQLSDAELHSINEMTAMDRIFGGKGATELAKEGAEKFLGPLSDQTEEAIPTALGIDFDEEMILGSDLSSELLRMYTLDNALGDIPEDQRDETYTARKTAIEKNIKMLKMARSKLKEKTGITLGERNTIVKEFSGELQQSAGLAGNYNDYGQWIPKYQQSEIFRIAREAGNEYANAVNFALENGLYGVDEEGNDIHPYTFTRDAAVNGFRIVIVPPSETSEGYLMRGEKVYDTNSAAFQQAISGAGGNLPSLPQSNAQTGAGSTTTNAPVNPPSGTGAATFTPSQRVAASIPKLKDPKTTPKNRHASAKSIMGAIKLGMPSASTADHEATFEQLTGMSFADAMK